jgi:hypothetical protein
VVGFFLEAVVALLAIWSLEVDARLYVPGLRVDRDDPMTTRSRWRSHLHEVDHVEYLDRQPYNPDNGIPRYHLIP